MTTKPLNQRQLFQMKSDNLTKRVRSFYEETRDSSVVFEYMLAIVVRDSLVVGSFHELFKELIAELLMEVEPTAMVRRWCSLFEVFCQPEEWKQIVARLFKNHSEYEAHCQKIRLYKTYVETKTTPDEEMAGQQFKLVSIFEDIQGKEHTWSLSDADPTISDEKAEAMLGLLTHLTIFEKDGVRRFAKLEKSDVVNCTRRELVKKEKKQKKQEEPATKAEEQKVQADRDRKKEEPSGKDQKEGSSPETKEMISATSDASSAHGEVERTSKSQAAQPKQKAGKSEREQKKKKTLLRNLGWGKKKERKKDRRK